MIKKLKKPKNKENLSVDHPDSRYNDGYNKALYDERAYQKQRVEGWGNRFLKQFGYEDHNTGEYEISCQLIDADEVFQFITNLVGE